jgi:Mrp family chromosome partitioning ATPase
MAEHPVAPVPGRPWSEPKVTQAVSRYRWWFAGVLLASLALGGLATFLRTQDLVATAEVLVRDPRSTQVIDPADPIRPERYVSDQADVVHSSTVAAEALRSLQGRGLAVGLEPKDLMARTTVTTTDDSGLITIRFRASDAQLATAGADTLVEAYQEVKRQEAESSSTFAAERIDASIERIDADLATVREQLASLYLVDERSRQQQVLEILSRLEALQHLGAQGVPVNTGEIAAATARLDALTLLGGNTGGGPAQLELEETQRQLIARRATLEGRRDEVLLNTALQSGVVVVSSGAADLPLVTDGSPLRALVLAGLFGIAAGTATCYGLALRNRAFSDPREPEAVFGSHVLASVPVFSSGDRLQDMPILAAPRSPAAERFRFVASAIDVHHAQLLQTGWEGGLVLSATSHDRGDGKTMVSVNACLALARDGTNVLLVDADPDARGATALVLGTPDGRPGLGEALEGRLALDECLVEVPLEGGGTLWFLPSGTSPNISSLLRSPAAEDVFSALRAAFDIVLVDCPPLELVAYATLLARLSDNVIAVVRHGAPLAGNEDLAQRLDFLQVPLLGYVYNRAPEEAKPYGPQRVNGHANGWATEPASPGTGRDTNKRAGAASGERG